jgi:hypothetical protein
LEKISETILPLQKWLLVYPQWTTNTALLTFLMQLYKVPHLSESHLKIVQARFGVRRVCLYFVVSTLLYFMLVDLLLLFFFSSSLFLH